MKGERDAGLSNEVDLTHAPPAAVLGEGTKAVLSPERDPEEERLSIKITGLGRLKLFYSQAIWLQELVLTVWYSVLYPMSAVWD